MSIAQPIRRTTKTVKSQCDGVKGLKGIWFRRLMRAQNPQAARIIPIILKVLAFFITIRKKIKSYKYITICYINITY